MVALVHAVATACLLCAAGDGSEPPRGESGSEAGERSLQHEKGTEASEPRPRHEIGLNLAGATPALKSLRYTYPLNYKYHFTGGFALRGGIAARFHKATGGKLDLDIKAGAEWGVYLSWAWRIFAGADASIAIATTAGSAKHHIRYGLSPVIGVDFFVSRFFSLGTEVKLFMFYNVYRDPDAFSTTANREEFLVRVASVGLLLLNFHF